MKKLNSGQKRNERKLKKIIIFIVLLQLVVFLNCQWTWISSFFVLENKIEVLAYVDEVKSVGTKGYGHYETIFHYSIDGKTYTVELNTDKKDLNSKERLLLINSELPNEAFRPTPISPYRNIVFIKATLVTIALLALILKIKIENPSDVENQIKKYERAIHELYTSDLNLKINVRDNQIAIKVLAFIFFCMFVGIVIFF